MDFLLAQFWPLKDLQLCPQATCSKAREKKRKNLTSVALNLKQTELFFNLKLVLGKVIPSKLLQSREGKNDHGSFNQLENIFQKVILLP
jgi:hypothetical protein